MTIKLVRLRFLSAFNRIMRTKSKSGKTSYRGLVLMMFVFGLVGASFAFMFSSLAYSVVHDLIAMGADWFYFLLFIGVDVSLVFIFGVFETKSEIFESGDNELLLSMPIKPFSVVLSRIISVIIWNYIESAVVFIPAVVVYAVCGGSVHGIIGSLILFLFIPLLPTALSCLVGFLVSFITARLKKKTFFTLLFFLVFFAAYMAGYSLLASKASLLLLNVGDIASDAGKFLFLRSIGEAALLKPLPLILTVVLALVSVAITVAMISLCFEKIAFSENIEHKNKSKLGRMKRASPVAALVKKELSRFFSSATYMINSALGLVFMLVFSVYTIVKFDELFRYAEKFGAYFGFDSDKLLTITLVALLSIFTAFCYISSCALSLEGKSLWIMKSMPVSSKDVLLSKVFAHLAVSFSPTLISSLLLLVASGDWIFFWYYIIVPQMMGIAGALIGVLWNTAFPKFDFENEASVIKNSASVFLTMLSLMILGAALLVLGAWLLLQISFVFLVALIEIAALVLIISALIIILLIFATEEYESL